MMKSKLCFDNRITWGAIVKLALIDALMLVFFYLFDIVWLDRPIERMYFNVALLLLCGIIWLSFWPRNKYSIQDDYLVIEEHYSYWQGLEQRIRIDDIDEIELVWSWSFAQKLIRIRLGDSVYMLNAVTHSKDLYCELSKRISKPQSK